MHLSAASWIYDFFIFTLKFPAWRFPKVNKSESFLPGDLLNKMTVKNGTIYLKRLRFLSFHTASPFYQCEVKWLRWFARDKIQLDSAESLKVGCVHALIKGVACKELIFPLPRFRRSTLTICGRASINESIKATPGSEFPMGQPRARDISYARATKEREREKNAQGALNHCKHCSMFILSTIFHPWQTFQS